MMERVRLACWGGLWRAGAGSAAGVQVGGGGWQRLSMAASEGGSGRQREPGDGGWRVARQQLDKRCRQRSESADRKRVWEQRRGFWLAAAKGECPRTCPERESLAPPGPPLHHGRQSPSVHLRRLSSGCD